MTLKEIIDKGSMRNIYEVRHITDDYVELVLWNKKLDKWNTILCDTLGPPKKPAGAKPSKRDLDLTQDHGGIWINQTLFRKDFGNLTVIAMYWPWQNDVHTTLKMANLKK
ncbi:MAG: hypothetical protein GTN81_11120 [Proteobacteria bacterium]|nr:hypothetical protein [Pseudomonadota bacterium]